MTATHRVRFRSIAVALLTIGFAALVQAQESRPDVRSSPMVAVKQQSTQGMMPNNEGDPAASDGDTDLYILTYNTQFRDIAADLVAPAWPNTRHRARAIGQAIACYDLIALQEEFRDERRAQVIEAAQTAGAHCGKPSQFTSGLPFTLVMGPTVRLHTSSPLLATVEWTIRGLYNSVLTVFGASAHAASVTNSGLLLLSRYPVRYVEHYTFQHKDGFDAWAKKGALHAVVCRNAATNPTDCLDVFVTHLQAGASEQAQRLGQVHELAQFIHTIRATSPDRPALVMGDFNINSRADKSDPTASQYTELRGALSTADDGLVDLWTSQPTAGPGYTNRRRRKRIDYIFVAPRSTFHARSVQVNEFRVSTTITPGEPQVSTGSAPAARPGRPFLSDHAGVEAHFVWEHPTSALSSPGSVQ